MRSERVSMSFRWAIVIAVTLAGVLVATGSATAQALKDLQTPDTPLVLKAQGSFYVGGEKSEQTQVELDNLGPAGHITVHQMSFDPAVGGRARQQAQRWRPVTAEFTRK